MCDALTAGLNNPPLMRKKTHAFTASENPKLKLMYSNSEGFFCATFVMTVVPVLVLEEMFATLQHAPSDQHLLFTVHVLESQTYCQSQYKLLCSNMRLVTLFAGIICE